MGLGEPRSSLGFFKKSRLILVAREDEKENVSCDGGRYKVEVYRLETLTSVSCIFDRRDGPMSILFRSRSPLLHVLRPK